MQTTSLVTVPDTPTAKTNLNETEKAEELDGKLQFQSMDDKLMHSVIENDSETIEMGKMLNEAMNNNLSAFTPDMMFEQMTQNYKLAKQIYGEKMIRSISGYDEDFVEKNIHIPEFQREMKQKVSENIEKMKKKKLLDRNNALTDKALELATLVSYIEEVDKLDPKGFEGERFQKKINQYGDKQDVRTYKSGDRYRDIGVRKTVKTAIRRQHSSFLKEDLKVHDRQAKGQIYVIYGLDSSASMKGKKIDKCKKAGIALAYRAIQEKDKVGLIVFGKEIEKAVPPTSDFSSLIKDIVDVRPHHETDLAKTIHKAVELFPDKEVSKHLILLTDALPTTGKKPEEETIEAASIAHEHGITISIVGINLDENGERLAQRITEIGQGKLYMTKDTDDLDVVILEDYYSM